MMVMTIDDCDGLQQKKAKRCNLHERFVKGRHELDI
jgi:hypothetical protein